MDLASEIVVHTFETLRPGFELLGPFLQPVRHALDSFTLAVELDLEIIRIPVVGDEEQRADNRR